MQNQEPKTYFICQKYRMWGYFFINQNYYLFGQILLLLNLILFSINVVYNYLLNVKAFSDYQLGIETGLSIKNFIVNIIIQKHFHQF